MQPVLIHSIRLIPCIGKESSNCRSHIYAENPQTLSQNDIKRQIDGCRKNQNILSIFEQPQCVLKCIYSLLHPYHIKIDCQNHWNFQTHHIICTIKPFHQIPGNERYSDCAPTIKPKICQVQCFKKTIPSAFSCSCI